jgi:hypothetical protein
VKVVSITQQHIVHLSKHLPEPVMQIKVMLVLKLSVGCACSEDDAFIIAGAQQWRAGTATFPLPRCLFS